MVDAAAGGDIGPLEDIGRSSVWQNLKIKLILSRSGWSVQLVHTFCLEAQGPDGDPVYLLDEF